MKFKIWPGISVKILRFLRQTKFEFYLTSHLKESVRKRTDSDEKMGKRAGKRGGTGGEKNLDE